MIFLFCKNLKKGVVFLNNRARKKLLIVYVNEKEYNAIQLKMKQFGTECFSVYARKMLIDGKVINISNMTKFNNLIYEINKIGVNINQLTKLANENKNISKSMVNSICKKQEELKEIVNERLEKIFGNNNFR